MHELSIAQNIIEIVTDFAKRNNAERVTEIVLDIGAVSGVIPENLEFAWEISSKGSVGEGSRLTINFIEAKAICLECKKEFKLEDIYSICEHCGSIRYDIINGKELKVKSIKIA
jgi:hydrogenase nickel incorporation protein HypA/HybF